MAKKRKPETDWRAESFRDWFAAYALMGMLASPPIADRFRVDKRVWAKVAYQWADAMIAARKR